MCYTGGEVIRSSKRKHRNEKYVRRILVVNWKYQNSGSRIHGSPAPCFLCDSYYTNAMEINLQFPHEMV